MFRLTIRATDESVPAVLAKIMEERLSAGASEPEELERPSREDILSSYGNVLVE